jgi:hypothetical protein
MQRRRSQNRRQRHQTPAQTKKVGTDGGNPATNGLSEPDWKLRVSKRLNGGRDRDRTCDPLDVNEVLSR